MRRQARVRAVILLCLTAPSLAFGGEELVWRLDFNDPAVKKIIDAHPYATLNAGADAAATLILEVDQANKAKGRISFPLPLDELGLSGRRALFRAEISYNGVSRPRERHNGVKFMLAYTAAVDGKRFWPQWSGFPQQSSRFGSHAADTAVWRHAIRDDARDAVLTLGLEDSTGRAEFSDVRLYRLPEPVSVLSLPDIPRARYTDAAPPRGRGVMSPIRQKPEEVDEDDFKTMRDWGANLLRWQLILPRESRWRGCSVEQYVAWAATRPPVLDRVFELAERYGIWVIVDLHFLFDDSNIVLHTREGRDAIVDVWRRLAAHCRGKKMLWGYDLLNEPKTGQAAAGLESLADFNESLIRAVREVDPDTAVIVGTEGDGRALEYLRVYPYDNIIYTFHCYPPMEVTHQINPEKTPLQGYPDPEKGWDKEYLRRWLRQVREFQLKTGARVYVGEFSVVRWAPGAAEWLADCVGLFEEYGWDWTYHALREWHGWDLELTNDPASQAPDPENDRLRVIREALAAGK